MTRRRLGHEEPDPPVEGRSSADITGNRFDGPAFLVGRGSLYVSEGGRRAEFLRPETWPAARDVPALGLGVHRARPTGEGAGEAMPPYVARDFDGDLRARLRRHAVDGGMVLLTGDSTSGKSRAACEAVKAEMPEHQVFSPPHGADLSQLPGALADRPGRYVLWLDDLEGFLGRDGLQPDLLSALLRLRLAVVATLRDGFREMFWPQAERRAAAGGDTEAQRRSHSGSHIIDMAELVEVPRTWTAAELERASWEGDARLVEAVRKHGKYGISEYLAAGPELWQEWRQAMRAGGSPRGWALVAAAIDLARTGLKEPFPVPLIEEAHEYYLAAAGGPKLRPESLRAAWEWAQTVRYGVTSLLVPGPAETEWRAFDYLTDSAFRDSRLRVPEVTWKIAMNRARNDDEKFDVGWQAMVRDAPRQLAAAAFEPLALAGDAVAANNMGVLSEARILDQAKGNMFGHLMKVISGKIDVDKAFDLMAATPFDQIAAEPMAALHALGIVDTENRPELADAERWYRLALEGGYQEAAKNLAELLRQTGRTDEAIGYYRQAVAAGVPGAAEDLRQLLQRQGQGQGQAGEPGPPSPSAPVYPPKSDDPFDVRVAGMMGVAAEALRSVQEDMVSWDKSTTPAHDHEPAAGGQPGGPDSGGPDYGRPVWERAGRRVCYGHNGMAQVVCAVEVSPGRVLLAAGGVDGTIRQWDPATGEPSGAPVTGHDQVTALCPVTLPDGRVALASGDEDGQIRLWEVPAGRLIRGPFKGHEGTVTALCTAGPGSLLASGGSEGLIQIWRLDRGTPTSTWLKSGRQPVRGLCAVTAADGTARIVSATGSAEHGGRDSKLQLWAADDDQPIGEPFGTRHGEITAICTLPDGDGGTLVAAGHADGTIRLWDPARGEQAGATLTGSIRPVRALCSVPLPGRAVFLACGGDDGVLQFWSPATGRLAGEIVPGERGKAVRSVCAVPVANQQAGLAVTGGGWTPDGAHWAVAMYYPKAADPGQRDPGQRGHGPDVIPARARRRRARDLPPGVPAGRPLIPVETDNAAAIAAFETAVGLVEQGDIDGAERLYRQGLAAGHYPAVNGVAMILEGRDELDEAERLYRKAARSFICQAELNLGDLLMRRGDRGEAVSWYREFGASFAFADPDSLVRFLLDEQNAAQRRMNMVQIGVDEDRVPDFDIDFADLEFAAALPIISVMRQWRHAHKPGQPRTAH
jgi:TPR repeat protein